MIKELLLNILLPKRCVSCGKEGNYICDKCELFLNEAPNTTDQLVNIWEHQGLIEKIIWQIKHHGQTHMIGELVEKAFEVMVKDVSRFQLFLSFLSSPDTYISYVPMHKRKEKQLGFNQAALIAKKLGQITKKEVRSLLIKTKDNASQDGLSVEARTANVKNVFQWPEGTVCPVKVVLVDDFLTSGATLQECSQILKRAGASEVWGFVLARAV